MEKREEHSSSGTGSPRRTIEHKSQTSSCKAEEHGRAYRTV